MSLLYTDLFNLIAVFLINLMADFTERSFQFNVMASCVFLLKCLISAGYRNYKSYSSVRILFAIRLSIDGLIIMPGIYVYRWYTATSSYNILMVFFITTASEAFLVLIYSWQLFLVSTVEHIEKISPNRTVNLAGFPQMPM